MYYVYYYCNYYVPVIGHTMIYIYIDKDEGNEIGPLVEGLQIYRKSHIIAICISFLWLGGGRKNTYIILTVICR